MNFSSVRAFFFVDSSKSRAIAFPKLLTGQVETFCDELVHKSGVLLLPGTMYDHPGNHFRLGFARQNMPEALARLEEFLKMPAAIHPKPSEDD